MHRIRHVLALIGVLCSTGSAFAAEWGITYNVRADAYAGHGDSILRGYGRYDQEIQSDNFQYAVANGTVDHQHQQSLTYYPTSNSFASASASANPSSSSVFTIYEGRDASGDNVDPTFVQANAGGSALASVSGSLNTLHAYAQATGKIDPVSYSYVFDDQQQHTQTPETFQNPKVVHGVALASIDVYDTITPESATLAYGTPVYLRLAASLDSNVTATTPNSYTWASASIGVGSDGISVYDDGTLSTDSRSRSGLVELFVGEPSALSIDLTASVEAIANQAAPSDVSTADASDTAVFHLDPASSDFYLASDSGMDYSTPVPEPATIWACVIGCALLARRRERGDARMTRT